MRLIPFIEQPDVIATILTHLGLWPAGHISFEHAWHLWQVFCRNDEFVLSNCPDCESLWVQDTLEILPYNCPACRRGLPARK